MEPNNIIVTANPPDVGIWHDLFVGGIGIVGALLGGAIGALMTGNITRKLGREAREQEQQERDRVAAFAMRDHLMRIYSSALSDLKHIKLARSRQKLENGEQHPHISLLMEAYSNTSEPITFHVDQLYSMSRVGGSELLNKVTSLDRQHNAISTTQQLYRQRRQRLMDEMPGEIEKGTRGKTEFDQKTYNRFLPRIAELDSVVDQLEELCQQLYNDSFDALQDLVRAQGSKLGLKFEIELRRLSGKPETIRSQPEPEPVAA